MNPWVAMVAEFHRKFGQPVAERPTMLSDERAEMRANLISEESEEAYDAICDGSMVDIADGLADTLYVVIGTALEYGIDLDRVFAAVHAANMRKEGGPTRADGKILKPPGWVGPEEEIGRIIEEQGGG
jgi:predicted HAD superfamily Cof-like phosphohydrolase